MDGNVNNSNENFKGEGPPPYQPPPNQPYQEDPYGQPPQQQYQQPYGQPPGPPMGAPPPPAQTAKPLIAGIMLIVFGLINAVYMAYNIITLETATSQYEGIGGDFLSFMADLFMICFAILMIFSIISVLGGIFAIKREKFSIAIIGAILGLFSLGPYCLSSIVALIALILLFVSKDEFL